MHPPQFLAVLLFICSNPIFDLVIEPKRLSDSVIWSALYCYRTVFGTTKLPHLSTSAQGDDIQVIEDPQEKFLRQLPVDQRRILNAGVAAVRVGEHSTKFPVRSSIRGSILSLQKSLFKALVRRAIFASNIAIKRYSDIAIKRHFPSNIFFSMWIENIFLGAFLYKCLCFEKIFKWNSNIFPIVIRK